MQQLVLDDWQQEAINHEGHLLLCTGRQCGKTFIMSRKIAKFMMDHPSSRIIVVSLTEDQAHLMIIMVLDYLQKNFKPYIARGRHKPTKSSIQLKNNSLVRARPVGNTGDAVRGFTGDILVIDEASRMGEDIFTSSKPTLLITGGKIWMCSTPFGKKGYFYECYLNKHNRFKVIKVNSEEVVQNRKISESWSEEQREASLQLLKEEKEEMSELQYGQEFLGLFLDDLQQFFPDKLIRRCMTAKRRERIIPDRDYYLGSDIGRLGNDPSTFEIVDRMQGNHLYHVENQVMRKQILTQTAQHIIGLNMSYNFRRIYIDNDGIGVGVLDILLTDKTTRRKTEGLRNSKKIIDFKDNRKTKLLKHDLYMNLITVMETGGISLLDEDEVFQSFKSVQYEFTNDKSGQPFMRFFGNDTHIVEGLTRAAWCIKHKNLNISIMWI